MTEFSKLKNNTGFSFLSNFIRSGTNFLIFAFLARVLCIEDFGTFAFSLTFAIMFLAFPDFGLERVTTRGISRNKKLINIYFSNGIVIKSFLTLATFSIVWITINIMGYPKHTKIIVYLLTISVIASSYTSFLNSLFRGIEQLKYETIVTAINNLILAISIFATFALGYRVMGFAISFIVSRAIGFVVALGILRYKVTKPYRDFDYQFCKDLFKRAIPFGLLSIFTLVQLDIDTVLLSYLKGVEVVGYYQAAIKIVGTFTVMTFILDGSFFPVLCRLHDNNNEFEKTGKGLMSVIFVLGIPLVVGLFVLAEKVIVFVYGINFLESIVVLQILSCVLLIRLSVRGYETILLSIGKQTLVFYVTAFALIVNIMLNIYSIPRYGLVGAGLSSGLTYLFIFICYTFIAKRKLGMFLFEKRIGLILVGGVLSGIFVYNLKALNLFMVVTIFAICYLGAAISFLKKERTYIFQMIKSKIV